MRRDARAAMSVVPPASMDVFNELDLDPQFAVEEAITCVEVGVTSPSQLAIDYELNESHECCTGVA